MTAPNSSETAGAVSQIRLPARLDTAAAQGLHADVSSRRGQDLNLDFADVRMLGALCLQLLMNVRHHWAQAGQSVTVANIPPDILKVLSEFGTAPTALITEGTE